MSKINALMESHFLLTVGVVSILNGILGWWGYVAVFAKL